MATLKDMTDALVGKGTNLSAAAHYDLLVGNEEALRLGVYGTREGGIVPHNHGSAGGELLTRPLACVALGPYSRPSSGLSPTLGVPVYPPVAGTDFAAIGDRSNKLLIHAGIYLPGGISAVRVRVGVRFTGAGARNFQLRLLMRPTQKLGFVYNGGNFQVQASATMSTTGANDFINSTFQMAPLSRLGDISQARWYELLIVLISNPTVTTTARLIGFKVDPVLFADQPPPNVVGLPRITIDTRDIQRGAPITERLLGQARAMLDGLIYATLGRIPGKSVQWGSPSPVEDKSAPYRVEVKEDNAGDGVHQHTGASYYDGALIAGQVACIVPIDDMADTVANEMDNTPVKGGLIDPTGAGTATTRKFKCRVSVARGDTKFILRVAVSPRSSIATGFLWLLVKSRLILDATIATGTDIITGIEVGQQNQESAKVGTYFKVQLQPENADMYQTNEARAAIGLLGHWTADAQLPTTSQSADSLGVTSTLYRVSKAVTINVNPAGRTGDVYFEFLFYLLDGAGAAQNGACLQWLALARPEEA